ncbi:MAG: hypothetical protein DCC69_13910 [Hyphomicrobiales bacterium]|nr:MAG: hypothetical protein DCC69_13910 [Hyphomicrobiales bacterium]
MNLASRSRRLVAAFGALALVVAAGLPAAAQDIAESHLSAARAALQALKATEEFDIILPSAAQALKSELIQKNPDLQELIIEVVDQTAFALAARRGDLEREAATIYARTFSETELSEISAFYTSSTGKKLLNEGANVTRGVLQAADIWQRGIARDLAQQAGEEIARRVAASQPPQGEAEGGGEEGAAQE